MQRQQDGCAQGRTPGNPVVMFVDGDSFCVCEQCSAKYSSSRLQGPEHFDVRDREPLDLCV